MGCVECGERVELPARGRTGKYCSGRCRQAAYRRRQRDKARGGVPGWLRAGVRWTRAVGKRPVMPNGRAASSTDPATWTRYEDVQDGAGDGYGVMLGGLACIDLDNCLMDGELSPFAQGIVEMNAGAYVEVSVSGNGLHIFGEFAEVSGVRRSGFEFYSRARFIRVTGDVFRGMCGAGGVVRLNVPDEVILAEVKRSGDNDYQIGQRLGVDEKTVKRVREDSQNGEFPQNANAPSEPEPEPPAPSWEPAGNPHTNAPQAP